MRPSDEVAAEVQTWRRQRRWSYRQLADALEAVGMPISESVLINVLTRRQAEAHGKRIPARAITIDEIVGFARAFDTSAIHFLPRSIDPAVYAFEMRFDSEQALIYFERHYADLCQAMEYRANNVKE